MKLHLGYALAPVICIMQSGLASDGLDTWTLQGQSVTTNALRGVTYGNGLFVAVGSGPNVFGLDGPSTILTSPDGITWTVRDSGITNGLLAVAYGNGRFVAVGRGVFAKLVTSSDGVGWTQQDYSAGVSCWLTGIGYGSGQFVAVGGINPGGVICCAPAFILTSPDGINWARRTNIISGELSGVANGGGRFVAVGAWDTFELVSSLDAVAWSHPDVGFSPLVPLYKVAYGNGRFVAVGAGVGYGSVVMSVDGAFWTKQPYGVPDGSSDIAYGNGAFVAVGPDSYVNPSVNPVRIASSPDGVVWTKRDSGTTNGLSGVAYGNGRFVAVGANGTILRSGEMVSLGHISLPNGAPQIPVNGVAGRKYNLDWSANLADWASLTNVTTDTNGTAQFNDGSATNFSRRFYRVVAP
jgi:hypothetical protein